MKLEFDVEAEAVRHVAFSFDKALHGLSITLDGGAVTYELRQFSAQGWDVRSYSFNVGTTASRHVTLETWARSGFLSSRSTGPKVLLPGLHPQPLRAFVDGQLVAASDHQPNDAPPRPLTL